MKATIMQNHASLANQCILPCMQESFFNYGAATQRWIPPERRQRAPNGMYNPLVTPRKEAGWSWNSTDAPANRVRCSAVLRTCFLAAIAIFKDSTICNSLSVIGNFTFAAT